MALVAGCTGVGVMGPPVGDWSGEDEADAGLDASAPDEGGGDATVDPDDVAPEADGGPGDEEADGAPVDDAGPVEPEEDAAPPEEDAGPTCTYPTGPYDFGLDDTVPAMRWPGAAPVGGETGSADFERFHCDPEVRSIFVYVGNTW